MELRDHPLLSYMGIHKWPPHWMPLRGQEGRQQNGEIGVLTATEDAWADNPPRIYLFMQSRGNRYIATLLISDLPFSKQLSKILKTQYGRTLEDIGSIDLSHLL